MIRILQRRGASVHSNAATLAASASWCAPSSSSSLAFRSTRVNLIPIPPAVWRVLTVGGLFVVDAFLRSHRQQVAKMERQEKENGTTVNADGTMQGLPMTSEEALHILGFPENTKTPFVSSSDTAKATERFHVLFDKAAQAQSPYLQGKMVAAFERCTNTPAPVPQEELAPEAKQPPNETPPPQH